MAYKKKKKESHNMTRGNGVNDYKYGEIDLENFFN